MFKSTFALLFASAMGLSACSTSGTSIPVGQEPTGEWYEYGEVKAHISRDQTQLYAVHFYQGVDASYWSVCTPQLEQQLMVVDVTFSWRKEIKSFTVRDRKWGDETFEVDLSSFPEAHKWLLSTLVKKGKAVTIYSRACGSGAVPYLVAIER